MHETSYSSLILIVCSSCKLTLHWQNYTPSNFQYCMNFCHFKAKGLSKAKAVSYSISHSVRNMNCLCCVFPPHVLCDPVSLSLIVHLILVCLVSSPNHPMYFSSSLCVTSLSGRLCCVHVSSPVPCVLGSIEDCFDDPGIRRSSLTQPMTHRCIIIVLQNCNLRIWDKKIK